MSNVIDTTGYNPYFESPPPEYVERNLQIIADFVHRRYPNDPDKEGLIEKLRTSCIRRDDSVVIAWAAPHQWLMDELESTG